MSIPDDIRRMRNETHSMEEPRNSQAAKKALELRTARRQMKNRREIEKEANERVSNGMRLVFGRHHKRPREV